mmetsp:Transcript_40315/g.79493  ORF Transcript_40315/g.79493 Transcript_40315/m.79493 type:complete len:91 (-) Transcript_40315:52-324(-)
MKHGVVKAGRADYLKESWRGGTADSKGAAGKNGRREGRFLRRDEDTECVQAWSVGCETAEWCILYTCLPYLCLMIASSYKSSLLSLCFSG